MPVQLENLNVESHDVLITPEQLKRRLPVPETLREQVNQIATAFVKSSTRPISGYLWWLDHVQFMTQAVPWSMPSA